MGRNFPEGHKGFPSDEDNKFRVTFIDTDELGLVDSYEKRVFK